MNNELPQEGQESIQRALNEAKREELSDKYGATFMQPHESLPPEVEAEWLSNVERFEQQYAAAKRVTVASYCGEPELRRCSEIPDSEISEEYGNLLEILHDNNIHVHFLAGCDDREAYRFITEDLFPEEMDDIRIDGMTCNFIYEEFYPNDEYDASQDAKWFLRDLFERDTDHLFNLFDCDELHNPDGAPLEIDEIRGVIEEFNRRIKAFRTYSIDNDNCTVNEGYATYQADLSWEGTGRGRRRKVKHSGRVMLRLKQGDYHGWKVCSLSIPGLEE